MVKVETIASSANTPTASSSRISAHTHITGLGLDENGDAIVPMMEDGHGSGRINTSGLVGQVAAREALGIVSDLVHSQRLAGRALLLVGPPGKCHQKDSNPNIADGFHLSIIRSYSENTHTTHFIMINTYPIHNAID